MILLMIIDKPVLDNQMMIMILMLIIDIPVLDNYLIMIMMMILMPTTFYKVVCKGLSRGCQIRQRWYGFDPSGEADNFLQRGVYRALTSMSNQTKMVWF